MSDARNDSSLSFHTFPKADHLRKRWIVAIRRDEGPLFKVKQPVLCPNDHAFCSTCMDVWLERNQQCPSCRTPINDSNPVKQIKGSLKDMDDCPEDMSNPSLRRARFELLYQEYEKEFLRLDGELRILRSENGVFKDQMVKKQKSGSICEEPEFVHPSCTDSAALLAVTRKLQDTQRLYEQLRQEMARVKQENNNLKDKNVDLYRENQRLRLEISTRSPHRYGRYTVATLEAKVSDYEKEISQLKKALERSDKYVEDLEKQMSTATGQSKVIKSLNVDILPSQSNAEIAFENPAKRQLFGASKEVKKISGKDSNSSEMINEIETATCIDQSVMTWPNSVAPTKERSPKKVHFSLPNDSIESNSFDLENPSPFEPPKSGSHGRTSANEHVPGYHGSNQPIELEIGYRHSPSFTNQNDNSDLDDTQTIRSELDDLNISLTPELSDCLKLLKRAEKRHTQHEEKEVQENPGVGHYQLFEREKIDQTDHGFSKSGFNLPLNVTENIYHMHAHSKSVSSRDTLLCSPYLQTSHTSSRHIQKTDDIIDSKNGFRNKNKYADKTNLLTKSRYDLGSDNAKHYENAFVSSMPITTMIKSNKETLWVALPSSNRRTSFDGEKNINVIKSSSLHNIPTSACKYSSLNNIPSSVSSSVTALSTYSQTIGNHLEKLNQLWPVPRSNKSPLISNAKLGTSNNPVSPSTGCGSAPPQSAAAAAAASTLTSKTSDYIVASATRPGHQLHTSSLCASNLTRHDLPGKYTSSNSQGLLSYTPSLYTFDGRGRDLSEDRKGNFSYVSTISNDLSSRGSDSFLTEPKKRLFESGDELELTLSPIKSTRVK